ncbi:MAG: alpha/beta fold hydrolase [Bacteroidia bacterium]|nr:alpha/beta fold hydrolase [Bacteroidia bacterium]
MHLGTHSIPQSCLSLETERLEELTIPVGHLHLETGAEIYVELRTWIAGPWPPTERVIWVIHALTGSADVSQWWPNVWRTLNLSSRGYTVISANLPGSCYGSTGPLSVSPHTGKPYYRDFPLLTTRDAAVALDKLRQALRIDEIHALIGASLGAQVGLEWLVLAPQVFDKAMLIAGNAFHSAWGIAFNEAQRMAIEADPTYFQDTPLGGMAGMRAARATAMLSYRSYFIYNHRQTHPTNLSADPLPAASYQRYQGEKLARRFNAYSYVALTRMMDSHHIARGRGVTAAEVLQNLPMPVAYVGIPSDILYPLEEQIFLRDHTPQGKLITLDSPFGHDAFLIEEAKMAEIIGQFLYE